MKKNEFSLEALNKNSKINKIDINLHEVCKSICKITCSTKIATGFFIKLYKDEKELLCLMTNEHVIKKKFIESNFIIDIRYNYEKAWKQIKLDKNKRYIESNLKMDFTIVEIIPEDNIKEKYFLLPNINNINFLKENIFIVQFPLGNDLCYSEGKIKRINGYNLVYDASTEKGSSGSPIFLKNSTEVIGIHYGGDESNEENHGIKIYSILQLLKSEKKEDKFMNPIIDANATNFYVKEGYYIG